MTDELSLEEMLDELPPATLLAILLALLVRLDFQPAPGSEPN